MIRKATRSDAEQIVALAAESGANSDLPVEPDKQAILTMCRQMIGNGSQFVMVSDNDGQLDACVAAVAQPSFWYRGLQASVILYYARKPGAGGLLLREFAKWVAGRPVIKVAVMEMEPGCDPRLLRVMRRLGFARQSTNLAYVRKT